MPGELPHDRWFQTVGGPRHQPRTADHPFPHPYPSTVPPGVSEAALQAQAIDRTTTHWAVFFDAPTGTYLAVALFNGGPVSPIETTEPGRLIEAILNVELQWFGSVVSIDLRDRFHSERISPAAAVTYTPRPG